MEQILKYFKNRHLLFFRLALLFASYPEYGFSQDLVISEAYYANQSFKVQDIESGNDLPELLPIGTKISVASLSESKTPDGNSKFMDVKILEIPSDSSQISRDKLYRVWRDPKNPMLWTSNNPVPPIPTPNQDPKPQCEEVRPFVHGIEYQTTSKSVKVNGVREMLSDWNEGSSRTRVSGNYEGDAPSDHREISTEFAQFFTVQFPRCVDDSARSTGLTPGGQKIGIVHHGIKGDENHASKSYHSVLRAMDLAQVTYGDTVFDYSTAARTDEIRDKKIAEGIALYFKERSRKSRIGVYQEQGASEEDAIKKVDEDAKIYARPLADSFLNDLDKKDNTRNADQRRFYVSLRSCWKKAVVQYHKNNCPGQDGYVDWNNSSHQHHLHLSLPYCPPGDFNKVAWLELSGEMLACSY